MDLRTDTASFYDLFNTQTDDVDFYRDRLPGPDARVLELGCGTGRVLVPLARCCGYLRGVEQSAAMLARCRDRLRLRSQANAWRMSAASRAIESRAPRDRRGGRFAWRA